MHSMMVIRPSTRQRRIVDQSGPVRDERGGDGLQRRCNTPQERRRDAGRDGRGSPLRAEARPVARR